MTLVPGPFVLACLVIMFQHILADIRLGGEALFLVGHRGRFVFQIIPLLGTIITDRRRAVLSSSSGVLAVQAGCSCMLSALVLIAVQSIDATCRQLAVTSCVH